MFCRVDSLWNLRVSRIPILLPRSTLHRNVIDNGRPDAFLMFRSSSLTVPPLRHSAKKPCTPAFYADHTRLCDCGGNRQMVDLVPFRRVLLFLFRACSLEDPAKKDISASHHRAFIAKGQVFIGFLVPFAA